MDIMHTTGGRTAPESETDATGGEEKTGHGERWASSLSLALFFILSLLPSFLPSSLSLPSPRPPSQPFPLPSTPSPSPSVLLPPPPPSSPLLPSPLSPGWSLSSVKVALSHLQWQREKVLRSETPLHLKIGSTLMEIVGAAFHLEPEDLLSRPGIVRALLSQHKRAYVSGCGLLGGCGLCEWVWL